MKAPKQHGYLIDPVAGSISEVDSSGKSFGLQELYGHLQCHTVDASSLPGATLWIDDNGALDAEDIPTPAFAIDGRTFFGRGLYVPEDGHLLDSSRVSFLGKITAEMPVNIISFSGTNASEQFFKTMENINRGRMRP